MRVGLTRGEVESLAKVMEIKFTVSGPPIGGAKSGINFNPKDPRKNEVLQRWYKAVMPLLKNYYGTGGDLNIDEIKEVIPITEDFGLWHPQEGVVNGLFDPKESFSLALEIDATNDLEDEKPVAKSVGVADRLAALVDGVEPGAKAPLAPLLRAAAERGLITGEVRLFLIHAGTLVLVTAYVVIASYAAFRLTDLLSPLRVDDDQEEVGLDLSQHGEQLMLPRITA